MWYILLYEFLLNFFVIKTTQKFFKSVETDRVVINSILPRFYGTPCRPQCVSINKQTQSIISKSVSTKRSVTRYSTKTITVSKRYQYHGIYCVNTVNSVTTGEQVDLTKHCCELREDDTNKSSYTCHCVWYLNIIVQILHGAQCNSEMCLFCRALPVMTINLPYSVAVVKLTLNTVITTHCMHTYNSRQT